MKLAQATLVLTSVVNQGGRGHYMMFPGSEPSAATDEHSAWLGTVPERPSQPQQMYLATQQQWYPAQQSYLS